MNGKKPCETPSKKTTVISLIVTGAISGIIAALIAAAYRYVLGLADGARTSLLSRVTSPWQIILMFVILALLGLAVGRVTEKEPLIKGSGIPQVEGQLLGYFSPRWLPVLLKKFAAGAVCVLCGLSLGREGPSIQLGAMAAQGFADASKKRGSVDRRYLIACGACAGLAAAFNAPLAGVMFALEEIHKNFSGRAVFSAMIAALCADVVSKLFFGTAATLRMVQVSTLPIKYYLLYIAVGVVCGAFGALYNKTLISTQRLYKKLPVSDTVRIMIPFLFAGVAALTLPQILGGGHGVITALAAGELALGTMALLLVTKFVFSMICFCSGAPGGIFFPLLVLGALAGAIVGRIAVIAFGIPESFMVNFMLLGMTGMFAGIVRAPLTGIVLVAEMSGSLTQFIGLAVVSCVSCLVASTLKSRPIYEQLLDNMLPEKRSKEAVRLSVIDVAVPYGAAADGHAIRELSLPDSCHIVGVLHEGEGVLPNGDAVLQAGDVVRVVCEVGAENELHAAVDAAVE